MITLKIIPALTHTGYKGEPEYAIEVQLRSDGFPYGPKDNVWTQRIAIRNGIPFEDAVKMALSQFTHGYARQLRDEWEAQYR